MFFLAELTHLGLCFRLGMYVHIFSKFIVAVFGDIDMTYPSTTRCDELIMLLRAPSSKRNFREEFLGRTSGVTMQLRRKILASVHYPRRKEQLIWKVDSTRRGPVESEASGISDSSH